MVIISTSRQALYPGVLSGLVKPLPFPFCPGRPFVVDPGFSLTVAKCAVPAANALRPRGPRRSDIRNILSATANARAANR